VPALEATNAIRAQIWQHGFRPLPVQNATPGDPHSGKAPLGIKWGVAALEDPPQCLRIGAVTHALNTGILCDGLRAIDLDIDDPEIAGQVHNLALHHFGPTIARTRSNSPRCLLVYRAATGAPVKLAITGSAHTTDNACKVEVLGRGQQFVAYGLHWTGADLQWLRGGPADHDLKDCPAVTEASIHSFLAAAATIIGAPTSGTPGNGQDHTPSDPQADPLRIATALNAIPNVGPADWEAWNRVGMAVWRATGGSPLGFGAWAAWSARNPSYNAADTAARWAHYATSPPTQIGAGTLFHMASEARQQDEDRPNDQPQPSSHPLTLTLAFGNEAAIPPPDQSTVVRGMFHKGSITLIYGLPKSGKSFLATNVALAVADDSVEDWMGYRIRQHGPVLYVACEGHGGFWKRLQAAGHVPPKFALATGRPMLIRNDDGKGYSWMPEPSSILAAIDAVHRHYGIPPVMLIIDTVFRSFSGGNVNDSSHMNAYIAAAQQIADQGIAVGLVHHTTKTGTSPAGSVALMGAADTLVLVEKDEDGSHRWSVEEAKDDASGEAVAFRLDVINGIVDAAGEAVSSCILVPLAEHPRPRHTGRPANSKRIDQVMAILARMLNYTNGAPVHVDRWREAVYAETMPGELQDTKRKTFNRDRDRLISEGRVTATGSLVNVP
jgi:hypothetical protein